MFTLVRFIVALAFDSFSELLTIEKQTCACASRYLISAVSVIPMAYFSVPYSSNISTYDTLWQSEIMLFL